GVEPFPQGQAAAVHPLLQLLIGGIVLLDVPVFRRDPLLLQPFLRLAAGTALGIAYQQHNDILLNIPVRSALWPRGSARSLSALPWGAGRRCFGSCAAGRRRSGSRGSPPGGRRCAPPAAGPRPRPPGTGRSSCRGDPG